MATSSSRSQSAARSRAACLTSGRGKGIRCLPGSGVSAERFSEPLERRVAVVRGPGLEADDPGVPEVVKTPGHGGVVDLTGARLAASRHVGDLDLTDVPDAVAD